MPATILNLSDRYQPRRFVMVDIHTGFVWGVASADDPVSACRRFVMVDIHTGFVWGVASADDPVSACRQMDESMNAYGRDYEEYGPRSSAGRSGQSGYLVYEAPLGFDVADGQDAASIQAVEALPQVAIVLTAERAA